MARHGRKYVEAAKLLERGRRYEIGDACELVPRVSISKFRRWRTFAAPPDTCAPCPMAGTPTARTGA
jgi:hypothetical protein